MRGKRTKEGKIPSPPTSDWITAFGSWEGFHKAAEKSVGRKLEKTTVVLSPISRESYPSQSN